MFSLFLCRKYAHQCPQPRARLLWFCLQFSVFIEIYCGLAVFYYYLYGFAVSCRIWCPSHCRACRLVWGVRWSDLLVIFFLYIVNFVTALVTNHVNKVFRIACNVVSNRSCFACEVECVREPASFIAGSKLRISWFTSKKVIVTIWLFRFHICRLIPRTFHSAAFRLPGLCPSPTARARGLDGMLICTPHASAR